MKKLALLAIVLSGCWVPIERGKQMESRIARLEQENDLRARQLDEERQLIGEQVAKVDAKIAEVQKKLDELNQTAHRTGADLAVNQDKLAQEYDSLEGQLAEAKHALQLLDQSMKQIQESTDARFAALKGAGALDEFEARKKIDAMKLPADKAELFRVAQKEEQGGDKTVARLLYDRFIQKFPTDPKAAEAWFRIGDIQYAAQKYREAILAFGHVVQDFPRADKAPDALFRTAESMLAIDLKDDAKAIFEDVLKRYPNTSAAKKSRARLAELAPEKKPAAKPKRHR